MEDKEEHKKEEEEDKKGYKGRVEKLCREVTKGRMKRKERVN